MDTYLFSILGKFSYLGLFVVLLAAGLGVPLPEDIPLLGAGWLVHHGKADLLFMMIVALVGVMIGDSLLFNMGRQYGSHIVEHRWLRRIAKPWLLEKARRSYANHGTKILFAARFMPGLRAVMFLTAGMFRVPYWKFLMIDGLAALISVPTWIWVGYKFTPHIAKILEGSRLASIGMGGILILALFGWGCWEYFHNLRRKGHERAQFDASEQIRSAPLVPPGPPSLESPVGPQKLENSRVA